MRKPQNVTEVHAAIGKDLFQSTLLREERRRRDRFASWCEGFQSTLLREERLARAYQISLVRVFQSTLLREERLADEEQRVVGLAVSIHAPARGATSQVLRPTSPTEGFQSTLLREERLVPEANACH